MSARPQLTDLIVESWDVIIAVGLGGALGALARFGLAVAIPFKDWPIATLTGNIVGAFLLAVLTVLATDRFPLHRYRRAFWGTGVLGGFTTFSTFMVEALSLSATSAITYILCSLFGGILAAMTGFMVARKKTS